MDADGIEALLSQLREAEAAAKAARAEAATAQERLAAAERGLAAARQALAAEFREELAPAAVRKPAKPGAAQGGGRLRQRGLTEAVEAVLADGAEHTSVEIAAEARARNLDAAAVGATLASLVKGKRAVRVARGRYRKA